MASSSYQKCLQSYRAQQYLKAATCLRALISKLDQLASPTKEQRLTKGSAIRSAAIALNKAARQAKDIEKAGYYRSLAVLLLTRYEREKLYPNAIRQKSSRRIRLQIQVALKLTPLSVLSGTPAAALTIEGYKYKATGQGKWLKSVRPGKYVVTARYKNGTTQTQKLSVVPGKAAFATFRPPAIRRAPPRHPVERRKLARRRPIPPKPLPRSNPRKTVGWVLLGIGGAAMLGSIAPFAMLQGANATLRDGGSEYEKTCANTPGDTLPAGCSEKGTTLRTARNDALTYQTAAYAVLGVGAVAAIVGVILVALPSPQPTRQASLTPRDTLFSTWP